MIDRIGPDSAHTLPDRRAKSRAPRFTAQKRSRQGSAAGDFGTYLFQKV